MWKTSEGVGGRQRRNGLTLGGPASPPFLSKRTFLLYNRTPPQHCEKGSRLPIDSGKHWQTECGAPEKDFNMNNPTATNDWLQTTLQNLSRDGFVISENVGDVGGTLRAVARRTRF